MKPFLAAVQFLTALPVRLQSCDDRELARSVIFFPLVGALLGAAAGLASTACAAFNLGTLACAVIPVALLAALTGGLHLDGLCDTADAFTSGKNREGMLAIMRDPHAGALGATAVFCVLLLKIAFLSAVPAASRGMALILACACARWPLALSIYAFPYARTEGKATPFFAGLNGGMLLAAGAVAVICSLIAGWNGILVTLAVTLFVILFDFRIKGKIGGLTGDTLGASVELAEVFALMLSAFIF